MSHVRKHICLQKLLRQPIVGIVFFSLSLAARADSDFEKAIAKEESRIQGRVGVFAIRGSRNVGYRADEQFSYCSVFKWILGAAVLQHAEDGRLSLTHKISYTKSDLVPHSPITSENVGKGRMKIEDLVAATIKTSDNTAANLLEPLVGGPAGLQSFVRGWGDTVTRFDRKEPEMSNNTPGDPRDKTSPQAMTRLLQTAFESEKLGRASRNQLLEWMKATSTGANRIRAGVPQNWTVGDKTGTCGYGGANDVAIIFPSKGSPIYVSLFTEGDRSDLKAHESAISEVAKAVLKAL
jgi:beta-lactamase class A